jgi:hypothetical protein
VEDASATAGNAMRAAAADAKKEDLVICGSRNWRSGMETSFPRMGPSSVSPLLLEEYRNVLSETLTFIFAPVKKASDSDSSKQSDNRFRNRESILLRFRNVKGFSQSDGKWKE